MNNFSEPLVFTEITTKTINAHSYTFRIDDIELNEFAILGIYLYDENETFICKKEIKLEGERYNNWGTDDSYIEGIVKEEIEKLKSSV